MSDDAAGDGGTALRFSRFTLLPQRQLLLDGEEPVRLGSRPMAILTLLVQRAGELVTKDEILAHAWPNISVDEGALRVHMATLRKTLGGDGFISNVVGRGYQFVHPLLPRAVEAPPPAVGAALPPAPGTVFGRDSATAELSATLAVRRLVTVTGPGGIGKTTLALATARSLDPAYRDGSRFIDLAPVSDGRLVAGTLASALGLPVAADPLPKRAAHYLWAVLIARIYEAFPLLCPMCGGQMRIIAFITHSAEIRHILNHIGVESAPPHITPARGPPLWEGCDAPVDDGAQGEPDWDLAAQPDEVDQRVNW